MSVPTPDPAFRWTHETWGPALKCRPLEAIAQHLFTSSPLALQGGSSHQSPAWTAALGSVRADATRIRRVRQVHGKTVRVVDDRAFAASNPDDRPDGDALVSNVDAAVLAVVVADCVPILLADEASGSAAAIHAGWRGTCAGIAGAAVESMAASFGTEPARLMAAIGPSIGPDDYQVGESVLEDFRAAGHPAAAVDRWFRRVGGTLTLDLWAANRDQLRAVGLEPDRIFTCGLSTRPYPGLFESYRRDGSGAGRMAALIVVP